MKELILRWLFWNIRVIFTPSIWILNKPINKEYSKELLEILNNSPIIEELDPDTIKIDGMGVWKGNYPYCFGYTFDFYKTLDSGLPTRKVILYLGDILDEKGIPYER